ncbi:VPLPA-CTERM sorting domain-containing protein [Gammaproteobacteria bacterium]|nr:VPLPA-CTERM sorting domain-containing protein [Gammaproteobacteria bacterium]
MKKSCLLGAFYAVVFSIGLVSTSNAGLIGDTINCDHATVSFITCNPSPAVVGSGTEFTVLTDQFFFDVSDTSIMITAGPIANPGTGWEFILSDLDWDGSGEIVGIDNFFSNVGPLTPPDPRFPTGVIESDIIVSPHSIFIDLSTSTWESGDFVSFDLIGISSVPLPSALWLFGSGLLGLIGISRRKKAA